AEAEAEAAAGHLVDVERADGEDEGAAGEGPGDPGGNVDLLGATRQVGRLGDRGAEQLRSPNALDPGLLGSLRLPLQVADRGSDRGDGDAIERTHRAGCQAATGSPVSASTASATRSRCQRASPNIDAFALPRLRKKCRSCSQVKPIPPCTWIEASGTRQPASEA